MELVFDADGLIKLTKSHILPEMLKHINATISKEVEKEVVSEGKKRFYEDAYRIERFIRNGLLNTKNIEISKKIENLLRKERGLGKGERSTLHLYINVKAKGIVSDDKAFLSLLERENIPFVRPSDLIIALSDKIGKRKSLNALKQIKEYIRQNDYEKAVEEIKGGTYAKNRNS